MQKADRILIWGLGEGKRYGFAISLFLVVGRLGSERSSIRTTGRIVKEL